ncbi:MAG: TolC family protein, partial [Bacteroidales bacterium]|nr:TolC family protein [Bacteroidales bacterium]
MKKLVFLILLFIGLQTTQAQKILSLDSCRTLAIENNKELLINKEKIKAAYYQKKGAFTNYLPKVSAQGTYMRNQKEFSLITSQQKYDIRNMGNLVNESFQEFAQNMGEKYPGVESLISTLGNEVAAPLNDAGEAMVEALRTDTRNVYAGAITVTQPLYMGGKIRAYNKISNYAEKIAQEQYLLGSQELLLNTDQTYWQVIALTAKKKLAESYLNLLQRFDSDLQKMIAEGVATKADGLSVQVKVNEAEMTLTKLEDGLALSKMLLCQICGLNIHEPILLIDENLEDVSTIIPSTQFDIETAYANRPELRSLSLLENIANQKVRIVRSDFLPSIALMGNYIVTNPNLFNSFQNNFRGMWNIGVAIQIPIWNWGEGIYKVKEAKSQALITKYQQQDIKEKVELEVNQSAFKINEALKTLVKAE